MVVNATLLFGERSTITTINKYVLIVDFCILALAAANRGVYVDAFVQVLFAFRVYMMILIWYAPDDHCTIF